MSIKLHCLKNPNITHEYDSSISLGQKDQYIIMRRPSRNTITANNDEMSITILPDSEAPAENFSNGIDHLDMKKIEITHHSFDNSLSVVGSASNSEKAKVLVNNNLEFEVVLQYWLKKVETPGSPESEKQVIKGDSRDKYELCHYIDPEYPRYTEQVAERYKRNFLEIDSALSWNCRVDGSKKQSLFIPINFRYMNSYGPSSEKQLNEIDRRTTKTSTARGDLWSEDIQATLSSGLSTWLSPKRINSSPVETLDKEIRQTKSEPHFAQGLPSSSSITRMRVLNFEDGTYANLHGFSSRKTEDDHFAPFEAANTTGMISAKSEAGHMKRRGSTFEEDTKNLTSVKASGSWKRSKKKKRRPRKWEKRDIHRMYRKIGKITGQKSYYYGFFSNEGRANPWRSMLVLLAWTTLILFLDDNYLAFARQWGYKAHLGFASEIHQLLGIALGFLLYMQAAVSSERWWNGRIEWQLIMEKNKRLTVLLNTHLNCLPLSQYGTRMIVAHTLCVWSFLQDKSEDTLREELSNILNGKTVARIMASSRRLRPLSVTYAFQRLIELCVSKRVLEKEALRDINPLLVTLGESFDACNRCRIAQLPWMMAVHLNSVVFGFVALLPFTLIGRSSSNGPKVFKRVEVNVRDISYVGVYLYVLIIGYAFYGLYKMAVDIEDPFSYKKESHSFGLWGLIEYWTALEITDIHSIFSFHICKNKQGAMNSNGEYGEYWTVVRLEGAIKKAIENGSIRNVKAVIEQLKENQRDAEYWRGFAESTIMNRQDSSEIYFSTAEEEEDAIQEPCALIPVNSLSPPQLLENDL